MFTLLLRLIWNPTEQILFWKCQRPWHSDCYCLFMLPKCSMCVCVCSIFIQADVGILSRWLLVLPKLNNQYVFPKTFLRLFSVKCSCLFLLEQTSTYLNFIVFKEMSHSIIKQCIMTLSALVLFIYLYCFVVTCWVACLHLNTTKPVAFCLWCSKR